MDSRSLLKACGDKLRRNDTIADFLSTLLKYENKKRPHQNTAAFFISYLREF